MKNIYEQCLKGQWITSGLDVQYKLDGTCLIFECSSGTSDWLHNFSTWVKPYKRQPVSWYAHAGFVNLWKSVRDEVAQYYDKIDCIAGYSQGSALAQLAAEDYYFTQGKPIQTIGFGSPRVFWMPGDYIKASQKLTQLVMVQNDLVTHVPFSVWGFKHVGERIILPGIGRLWSTKAHIPDVYREKLTSLGEANYKERI